MKKHIIYIILIAFIFSFSCKKDEPSSIKNDCIEIPDSQSPFGYDYTFDASNYYEAIYFNPNNGSEILFTKKTDGISEFFLYNLSTKNVELLLTNNIYSQPCWARNDWILLGLDDSNIWKIKSNGDSLTQLTFDGGNYNPVSNHNSDIFICSNTDKQCFFFYDFYGNIQDTLKQVYVTATFDWNYDDNILIPTYEGVNIYNYNTKITSHLCNGYEHIKKATWISSNEFIMSTNNAIYKTNISNGTTVCIKTFCNAWTYIYSDYSEQSTKLIWQKVEKKKIGDNLIEVKSKLVLMDTDGSNEEEIVIKW